MLSTVCACLAALVAAGCGKKGPPLPPLVKVPAPPANFTAERRGSVVDLQFDVPASNSDNTRPANIARVEVYAMTSLQTLTDDQIIKQGTKVATIAVKTPKDPNQTIDEDESDADMEAPEGPGLEQGSVAHASETLTPAAQTPIQPKADKTVTARVPDAPATGGPLLPVRAAPVVRAYLIVGVSPRDRKGPPSKRIPVPLVNAPPAPKKPDVSYDEKAIAVKWERVTPPEGVQRAPQGDELPSRPLSGSTLPVAYNVYDSKTGAKLTQAPVTEPSFSDTRIVWGQERCYVVRAIQALGDLKIESGNAAPGCTTPVDTFPPAQPQNLLSSPAPGAISLIWNPNTEADLAGYLVLRGLSADSLTPISPELIQETTYRDEVQAGVRYTYAVIAVDRAGNRSAASKPIEEAARE